VRPAIVLTGAEVSALALFAEGKSVVRTYALVQDKGVRYVVDPSGSRHRLTPDYGRPVVGAREGS
jgi:hypothetical protein